MSQNNYGLPYPLTAQAIFDKAALHLLRQGRKSLLTGGGRSCAYRGHDGTTCAVGILISEDQYSEKMEGAVAFRLIADFLPDLKPFESLLTDLQKSHDKCLTNQFHVDEMRQRLIRVAVKHDLSIVALCPRDPLRSWAAPKAVELTPPALPEEITRLLGADPVEA